MKVMSRVKLLLLAGFAVSIFLIGPSFDNENKSQSTGSQITEHSIVPIENPGPLAPLYKGSSIEQAFSSNLKNLNEVSLYAATYFKSDLSGSGTFKILDRSRAVLISEKFQLSTLKDNTFFSFKFESIKIDPGAQYFLTLSTDVVAPAPTFTLWTNKTFSRDLFALKENGISLPGSIIFKLYGEIN